MSECVNANVIKLKRDSLVGVMASSSSSSSDGVCGSSISSFVFHYYLRAKQVNAGNYTTIYIIPVGKNKIKVEKVSSKFKVHKTGNNCSPVLGIATMRRWSQNIETEKQADTECKGEEGGGGAQRYVGRCEMCLHHLRLYDVRR